MKKFKLSFLVNLFIFVSVAAFGLSSIVTIWGTCGGPAVSQGEINVPEDTPDGVGDSTQAVIDYSAWVVSLADNIKCSTRNSMCTKNQTCKKKLAGIGAEGTFPTPMQVAGEWEFPDQGETTVFIKCKCVSKRISKVEIFEIPYEPYIGGGGLKSDEKASTRVSKQYDLINIYPNPTRDLLNINFDKSDLKGDVVVHVYNSLGQQFEKIEFDPRSESLRSINTSDYETGIYFLTIISDNTPIKKAKFIIAEE